MIDADKPIVPAMTADAGPLEAMAGTDKPVDETQALLPVTTLEAIAFIEHAFRNIDLPPLGPDDLADIADGLGQFLLARAALTPSPCPGDGWLSIDTAPRDGTWFIADGGGCERPTPMKAMAERIANETIPEDSDAYATHEERMADWYVARDAALAAITAVTERAAKLAEWAHMVPPDGGSPTEEEARLAATIATALRNFDHLKGATPNG